MFCQSCGEKLPNDARFCPKCGQRCSAQVEASDSINSLFDDELTPVDKPKKAETRKADTDKNTFVSVKNGVKTAHSDISVIGSTEWRYWHENGSSNELAEYFDDTLFTISFIPNGDVIDMPLMSNKGMIIPGPVGHFSIGKTDRKIFYLNENHQLIACDLNGKNEVLIAGGNGERVTNFVLNEDHLFLTLQAKDEEKTIFQISQSLDTSVVLKKGYNLRGLSANQDYLYYIDGTALTQRDLKTGTEKVILDRTGLNTFQLYNGYLVLTVSDNIFSQRDDDNYILLIDPSRMLQRTVVHVAAKNVNCYWDHVFYTDTKNEYVWTIPLNGGEAHLLRNKASDNLSAACGQLFFVDCSSRRIATINLRDGSETPLYPDKISEAEVEAFQYSLLNQGAEHYRDYSLNQALLESISLLQEIRPKAELFSYVAFLTLPQLNRQRENIPSLLATVGYQQAKTSQPILFVDTTISHKRTKGFIVATDGIYTDKTFFPYDYTFDCTREGGVQNIRLTTYEKIRFGKVKRTLDISCPMFKDGIDDLAELIYTVYAFSYFRSPAISDGYILPHPKDLSGRKKPGYIVSPKKKAPEESKPSEDIKTAAVNREQEKTASPPNADSANAENSEGITEEIKEIKKKEYSTEMDQLWRSKPFKDVFLYNFVKVLLEFLFPLSIGIVMWAGGSIQIFFERHIDSSLLLIITGLILIIVGIAAIILIAVGMIYICISLNEKISGAEGEAIKKKYTPFGINDSYTPIGIREGRNAVAVIVCWGSAFILLILLADIFTL